MTVKPKARPRPKPAAPSLLVRPELTVPERWDIHLLLYGDTGTQKTRLARTFPTPMVVKAFDTWGKMRPFLSMGATTRYVRELDDIEIADVTAPDGSLLYRVEMYRDINESEPYGYQAFQSNMAQFHEEYADWRTCVVDNLTSLEYAARCDSMYRKNVSSGGTEMHGKKHYAESAEACQRIGHRLPGLPMNTILIAHTKTEQDEVGGTLVFNPGAPGQQSWRVPSGFDELYRAYTDNNGNPMLQTQRDAKYNASTQIPAPNPCPATHYDELWKNLR